MTSIVSGSGAVRVTEEARDAIVSMSRRSAASVSESLVPFCVLKFVPDAESTLGLETFSPADSATSSTWEKLVESLPREECRIAVVEVPWTAHSDNVTRSKLVMVLWTPSYGPTVKQRMVASMFSKGLERLIEQWVGMPVRVEAGGIDDLELSHIQDKIRSKATVK